MAEMVLIGFMGAGKTTVGQALATALALDFIDLDEKIVEKLGMSIAAYFACHGEEAFRQQETLALGEALKQPGILATGGGVVISAGNRALLAEFKQVVHLAADPLVSLERIEHDTLNVRPLAVSRSEQEMVTLYEERASLYQGVAKWTIDTSCLLPHEVVAQILQETGGVA